MSMRGLRLFSVLCAVATASGPVDAQTATRKPVVAAPDARVARADLSRILGAPSATTWVLIISDFQCPVCKQFHDGSAAKLKEEFVTTGKVRFAYLHYPLSIHPNARPAAEASMCAGAQDRFWPFHDRLFATQERWSGDPQPQPAFERIATELKLDLAAWRQCMQDDVMLPMIDADQARGRQAGARSTPTFIIGNTIIPGLAPTDVIRSAITRALAGTGK